MYTVYSIVYCTHLFCNCEAHTDVFVQEPKFFWPLSPTARNMTDTHNPRLNSTVYMFNSDDISRMRSPRCEGQIGESRSRSSVELCRNDTRRTELLLFTDNSHSKLSATRVPPLTDLWQTCRVSLTAYNSNFHVHCSRYSYCNLSADSSTEASSWLYRPTRQLALPTIRLHDTVGLIIRILFNDNPLICFG